MHNKNNKRNKKIIAIDFFSGCGGVSYGLRKAGIKVLVGLDNNEDVRYAYEENNKPAKFLPIDISDTNEVLKAIKPILDVNIEKYKLFAACAPCQPFSLHNRNFKVDERKSLMLDFLEVFCRLPFSHKPDFVIMENVGPMKKRGNEILDRFVNELKSKKYLIMPPKVINAAHFGVPQNRKRLIFLAVKETSVKRPNNFTWDYFYEHYCEPIKKVEDVISGLPSIPSGYKNNPKDPLHVSRDLSPVNIERIKIPREKWPKKLNLKCYENHKGHRDVYRRMRWDAPAPTLTTKCISLSNGRFGHPEQDRAISLREAAILQTMNDFKFAEPVIMTKVAEQIGNAVPPKLAEKLGKFILEII